MIDYEQPIIGMCELPNQEEMILYEKIFWSKNQLDRDGKRTNKPRHKPPEDKIFANWCKERKRYRNMQMKNKGKGQK